MNQHLQQLIDLSHIDKDIDAFDPQIEEANLKLETILAKKETKENHIAQLEVEIAEESAKKQKNEMHIAELSAKLEDNSKKGSSVKTEREMKSLQLEEEIAKEQLSFANDEIERLNKVIDSKNEQLESEKALLAEINDSISAIKSDVDEKIAAIDKDRQVVFMKKQELISKMNQKGLAFYQKIRRWAKNTTAVEVKHQACMGCFMAINDKVYSEVIKGEEITTCPHCGRILYMPTQEEQSA